VTTANRPMLIESFGASSVRRRAIRVVEARNDHVRVNVSRLRAYCAVAA